ncbi:ABC transporter permease [Streptomyces sp. NPDC058657]|uniref:ABC transporter permease n=1 Tax=unclassified Streptomyces TaxID=2593676 RepID=UPI00365B16C4
MTAPLTPPHQPSPHDPWQTPAAAGATYDVTSSGDGTDPAEPGLPTEIRRAVVVMVVMAVAGLLLGLLWAWLAPKVPLVSTDKAVFLQDTEGEAAAGADGTFVLLSVAFGVLSAVTVFWLYRRGGIPLVIALLVGGLMGAWLGWLTGEWFGPSADVVARAKTVGVGEAFEAPLKLGAKGVLLAWPFVAVLVHLGLTAMWGVRDPEPEWGYEGVYGGPGLAQGVGHAPGPVDDAAQSPGAVRDAAQAHRLVKGPVEDSAPEPGSGWEAGPPR